MNISVTTLATDNLPYANASIQNKKEYCQKHGYDFKCYTESFDDRPHPWGKIKAVESVLGSSWSNLEMLSPDWVLWVDADAFIMNDEIKLDSIVDNEYDFIISTDCFTVNSGVFFVKNTENSKTFLKKVYEKDHYIKHPWWEQAAIIEYLHEPNPLKVKTIKQRVFNSYPNSPQENSNQGWTRTNSQVFFFDEGKAREGIYEEGDFILHFAGFTSQEEKIENMNKYHIQSGLV